MLPIAPAAAINAISSEAELFRALPKASWLWKFVPSGTRQLNAFAVEGGVTTLFVSLSPDVRVRLIDGDRVLADQIRILALNGVEMWALAGDPSWLERPQIIPNSILQLMTIQSRYKLFGGLHLDVEPHAHPDWRIDQHSKLRLLENFANFLGTIRTGTNDLRIDAALHPTLERFRLADGCNALAKVAVYLSSVALMAYRDSAAATLEWAASSINILQSLEKNWRAGVLVHDSTEPHTSFFGMSPPAFQSEMRELDRLLHTQYGSKFYRGLAIEDFNGLQGLIAIQ